MRPADLWAAAALSAIACGLPVRAANGIECGLSDESVPAYGRIEIRFANGWKLENPDDPRQADITGVFTSPSGHEWRIPGFLDQDFAREGDRIVARGRAEWRVRFTPRETGRWKASVRAVVGGTIYAGEAGSFAVTKNDARGFLRRSKANPLALEFDDGAPLLAIGSNVFPRTMPGRPMGTERALDVMRYLERTAAAGGNFCRLRVDSDYIPIELARDPVNGYEGVGRYHAQSCWEVDQIVAAAERLGITLQFCISDALTTANPPLADPGPISGDTFNYFLKSRGGPIETREQFWTDAQVKQLFLQKMRYAVARWGYSPAIGIWEFFNEIKLTPETIDAIADWHRELAGEWRGMDPYQHLITTSPLGGYRGADYWWKLFVPELDVIEYHTYAFEDLAAGVAGANGEIVKQTDRPLLVGEFGSMRKLRLELGGLGSDPRFDPVGLHLHNGMWASAMTGAAGALPWFIGNYIDKLDLYHVYTGLSRFAADWKINAGPWRPVAASVQADFDKSGKDRWGPLELSTHDAMAQGDADVYPVNRDGSIGGNLKPNGFLFGPRAHPAYRRPPIFEVDYPQEGTFVVTVKFVVGRAGEETPVIVEVDGRPAARKVFDSGEAQGKSAVRSAQYDIWTNSYDEEIAVPVSAGKHRIRVDTQGPDRVSVGYRLTPYLDRSVSVYRVYAMGLGGEARLWVQNSASTSVNFLHQHPPADQRPATLRVAVTAPGRYEAEWWDTVKGVPTRRATFEAKDGFVLLDFPGTLSDEACKLRLIKDSKS